MALLNLGDDPWLIEFDSCEKLQRNIMEQLHERGLKPRNTDGYARLSATVRLRLKQYNNEVDQLNDKLKDVSKTRSITNDEIERRTRQIEQLKSRSVQMNKIFNDVPYQAERSLLLGADDWGSRDDALIGAESSTQSLDDIRRHKDQMLQDQERGLENLSKIIARQKNIAQTIHGEVDLQNDIIDDLGDQIERTDLRINNETRNITVIDRRDNTCVYWVIIILLFLSIITVIAAF